MSSRDPWAEFNVAMADITKLPPDAGDSVLATFGLKSWVTTWLLERAPELLAMTPKQLVKGLVAPHCPYMTLGGGRLWACGKPMLLRVADAEGRQPRRLVWRHYHEGGNAYGQKEVDLIRMPRPKVNLAEIVRATQRGATIDFQRLYTWSDPEIIVVEPKKKARQRRPAKSSSG